MVLDSWFPCWHNQSEVCKLLGNSLLTQTILWSMMQQHLIDCSPFIARYILSFVFCVPQTEWSWFLYQQHTLPTWLAPWPQCYSHLDPGKGLVICSCLQRLKTVFIHLQTNGISRTYPIKTLHCWSQQTWTQTFLYSLKRKTIGPAYCCNIWCSFLPPHTSARLSLGTYSGCCIVNEIRTCCLFQERASDTAVFGSGSKGRHSLSAPLGCHNWGTQEQGMVLLQTWNKYLGGNCVNSKCDLCATSTFSLMNGGMCFYFCTWLSSSRMTQLVTNMWLCGCTDCAKSPLQGVSQRDAYTYTGSWDNILI